MRKSGVSRLPRPVTKHGARRASLLACQELARLELSRTRPWIHYSTYSWFTTYSRKSGASHLPKVCYKTRPQFSDPHLASGVLRRVSMGSTLDTLIRALRRGADATLHGTPSHQTPGRCAPALRACRMICLANRGETHAERATVMHHLDADRALGLTLV